ALVESCSFAGILGRLGGWLGLFGRAIFALFGSRCLVGRLTPDKPSRFAFPITALRLIPISRAICARENPASIRFLRSAMSSVVHVLCVASMIMASSYQESLVRT